MSMGLFFKLIDMIAHQYFVKVKNHFNGDEKKAWEWFKNLHPNFGMLSPLNMIKLGKEKKVIEFIESKMR